MKTLFSVTIRDPMKLIFEGKAISAIFPGESGEFTIMAHHEPIIALIKTGTIRLFKVGDIIKEFDITSGIVSVKDNICDVLLE